ncbi:MAG: hypothetical protein IPI67_05635 [Myxococcales bacterium]|nr:hypothetical protein [Myxococcales bacterium]
MRISACTALTLSVCACTCRGPEPSRASVASPETAPAPARASVSAGACPELFEPPSGAETLCDQHDLATTAEVHWRSFATTAPIESINQRYRERAEQCGIRVEAEGSGVRLERGPLHLSTFEATGSYPRCDSLARAEHRTVILVSSMFRR